MVLLKLVKKWLRKPWCPRGNKLAFHRECYVLLLCCLTSLVMSEWSVDLTTLFLSRPRLTDWLTSTHSFTSDWQPPFLNSKRERMTVENISWSIPMKEWCQPGASNSRPLDYPSKWATCSFHKRTSLLSHDLSNSLKPKCFKKVLVNRGISNFRGKHNENISVFTKQDCQCKSITTLQKLLNVTLINNFLWFQQPVPCQEELIKDPLQQNLPLGHDKKIHHPVLLSYMIGASFMKRLWSTISSYRQKWILTGSDYTHKPLYNTVHYKRVMDITWFEDGSQKWTEYIEKGP